MSKLKYKVGDKVRIKSIDWYNENKDELGKIDCGEWNFTKWYTPYCGAVMTIRFIWEDDECYKMFDSDYHWTDEMIECKVEDKSYFILDLSHKWVSELHGEEFNSTNEEHCFQSYAFQDGYKQGIEDCLDTLEIYLHDIFTPIGVERTMKHLKDTLKDNGMIKEE